MHRGEKLSVKRCKSGDKGHIKMLNKGNISAQRSLLRVKKQIKMHNADKLSAQRSLRKRKSVEKGR